MKRDRNSETPHFAAWAGLLRTHKHLLERVQGHLAEAALPPLEWYDVLLELDYAEAGRLRLYELGERIALSRSNITRLLDRLEKEGLIRREACAEDRRGLYATLTDAGRELRRRMWPVYRRAVDQHFARHLSEAEAEELVRLTRKARGG